jgi:hypothetical protein
VIILKIEETAIYQPINHMMQYLKGTGDFRDTGIPIPLTVAHYGWFPLTWRINRNLSGICKVLTGTIGKPLAAPVFYNGI